MGIDLPTHPKQVCGLYYFDVIEVVTMKPEEHKGFMITESPGGMYKATKIVPSALFKHPLHACSTESLKTAIDYELKRIKPINRKKPVNNQG